MYINMHYTLWKLWGNGKYILVFALGSWHRIPEILIISLVIWVSFILMRWLVTGKIKPWVEVWNFQSRLSFFWEGRRAENEVNDWSHLHDEGSLKSPKNKIWGAIRLVNTSTSGEWCIPTSWRQKVLYVGPSQTSPFLFIWLHLYPLSHTLINWYKYINK